MFDSRIKNSQIDPNLDMSCPEIPRMENYFVEKERLVREYRESLSKLPRWRRKLIESALDGGW